MQVRVGLLEFASLHSCTQRSEPILPPKLYFPKDLDCVSAKFFGFSVQLKYDVHSRIAAEKEIFAIGISDGKGNIVNMSGMHDTPAIVLPSI